MDIQHHTASILTSELLVSHHSHPEQNPIQHPRSSKDVQQIVRALLLNQELSLHFRKLVLDHLVVSTDSIVLGDGLGSSIDSAVSIIMARCLGKEKHADS